MADVSIPQTKLYLNYTCTNSGKHYIGKIHVFTVCTHIVYVPNGTLITEHLHIFQRGSLLTKKKTKSILFQIKINDFKCTEHTCCLFEVVNTVHTMYFHREIMNKFHISISKPRMSDEAPCTVYITQNLIICNKNRYYNYNYYYLLYIVYNTFSLNLSALLN